MNRLDQRIALRRIARQAMLEYGLDPDFPPAALDELARIVKPPIEPDNIPDLRELLWCSIDNDDSRDLDQLTVAEPTADGGAAIRIAIADVSQTVRKDTALDTHAKTNTTSVYTPVQIFPMLPEKLSTNLTSLNAGQDRKAFVTEIGVGANGQVREGKVYRAIVRNHAKLAYRDVGQWLEGHVDMPAAIRAVQGLESNLRLQDEVACRLRTSRHEHGALDLDVLEPEAVVENGEVIDLRLEPKTRAAMLIEDFMIAANVTAASFLEQKGVPSLRRVVRSPERWERIVEVAREYGDRLPPDPDSKGLADFLSRRREADPATFPDLSLTIVKLLGRGEYVVETPGGTAPGHFALAVQGYTHSTAPNRRFPDLVTQRLIEAALTGRPDPYEKEELEALARRCTQQADAASKVERRVRKAVAATMLAAHVGEVFDGIVTGASEKGTWVRIVYPPVEGKLDVGRVGLDVGHRIRVTLVRTDIERGFIDFVEASAGGRMRRPQAVPRNLQT